MGVSYILDLDFGFGFYLYSLPFIGTAAGVEHFAMVKATVLVNLSLSKLLEHSFFSSLKHVTEAARNDCVQA